MRKSGRVSSVRKPHRRSVEHRFVRDPPRSMTSSVWRVPATGWKECISLATACLGSLRKDKMYLCYTAVSSFLGQQRRFNYASSLHPWSPPTDELAGKSSAQGQAGDTHTLFRERRWTSCLCALLGQGVSCRAGLAQRKSALRVPSSSQQRSEAESWWSMRKWRGEADSHPWCQQGRPAEGSTASKDSPVRLGRGEEGKQRADPAGEDTTRQACLSLGAAPGAWWAARCGRTSWKKQAGCGSLGPSATWLCLLPKSQFLL